MKFIQKFNESLYKIEVEEITNILQDFIDDGYDIKIVDLSDPNISGSDIIKITLTIFPDLKPRVPSESKQDVAARQAENARIYQESKQLCMSVRDEMVERLYDFEFNTSQITKDDIKHNWSTDNSVVANIKVFKKKHWLDK